MVGAINGHSVISGEPYKRALSINHRPTLGSIQGILYDNYMGLVGELIRSGLREEGPSYLQTQGGRNWCWWGGIEPQVVWERAMHLGYLQMEPIETTIRQ